jgi:Na+/phosphate symporter
LVGFLYYLRGQRHPASISTGVLALLTTAIIYIPALLPGFWLLHTGWLGNVQLHTAAPLQSTFSSIVDPVVAILTHWLPGWGLLLCGAAVLLLAFNLLDRTLPDIDAEHSAFGRIGRLVYRPMAMFLLGAGATALTMSVSVSMSVLVPLSVKGLVRRENILPYIMGANITTFIDTLIAALLVGGPAAFTIVLVEMVSVTALSLLVLLCCYRPFERTVLLMQEQIVASRTTLLLFLAAMLLIPLLLLVL